MKKKLQLLAASLAFGACSLAHGAVINFDAPGVVDIDANNVAVYQEAGFAIAGDAAGFLTIDGIGSGMTGALVLLANNAISLMAMGGAPFSFTGLDAGVLTAGEIGTLSITGFFQDNTQQSLMLSLGELASYSFDNWSGLSSLGLTADADLVLDNLALSASPVPEPGSIAMLMLGLASLAGARRLTKKRS